MTFTDEDLKRLKCEITAITSTEEGVDDPGFEWAFRDINKMQALLARLEAAEDYISALTTGTGIKTSHLFDEAWRKSKGG